MVQFSPARIRMALSVGLLALAVAACAPPTTRPTEPAVDPRVQEATRAAEDGRLATAARLFREASADAAPPARDRLRLRAALVNIRQAELAAARELLGGIPAEPDDPATRALATLVRATLALEEQPGQAAEQLADGPPEALPDAVVEHWLESRARALAATGRHLDAARQRVERSTLLENPEQRDRNREALWAELMATPLAALREAVPAAPDTTGGWLELAHALRTERLDPEAVRQGVTDWQDRYPEHPAARSGFARRVTEEAVATLATPDRVAVLLPLSGRFAPYGQAVMSGIMTAYYQHPAGQRPTLTVYDTGEAGIDSLAAYQRAITLGADLVIGPLTKPALLRLTGWDNYPTPILALNRAEAASGGAPGLFQFGLAPEDDASAAARLALDLGLPRVVTLTPDSEWGDRIADAFRRTLDDRTGTLLEAARYPADGEDFSAPIRAVLNLDASTERYRRLRSLLNRNLQFEPRRRQDVSAVLIAAQPEKARLLKPQIRFHRGIDLPVVATSHAYSGTPAPDLDDDMNGLRLVVTPWTLAEAPTPALDRARSAAVDTWPAARGPSARLVALGIDALRLAGPVDVLGAEPTLSVPGLSGRLSISDKGIVHRSLEPARIEKGRLEVLALPGDGSRP